MTEVFFPDAKIYSGNSYFRRTKLTVLKELNKWKSYLAAGELDPNGLGKDEKGNYYFDINQVIERLKLPYMELTSWDYGLYMGEVPGEGKDMIYDVGYILHYTRNIENIPVTYTEEPGGEQENRDTTIDSWGYEDMTFYVGSDGISEVKIDNLYDVGETKTEQVNLKSFGEIIKIYEKMMLIQNAQYVENKAETQYRIDRITFGYSRIYEPSTDSETGMLVPVWDFLGECTVKSENEELLEQAEGGRNKSFLTINAVDGSVINRALGY